MTYGKQVQFSINAVAYPIAVSERGIEFNIEASMQELEKVFNNWQGGMGFTEDTKDDGYWWTTDLDPTQFGRLRMHPDVTITTGTPTSQPTGTYGYYFEASVAGTKYVYVAVDDRVIQYNINGTYVTDVALPANSVAGRPAYWNGKWYIPCGNSAFTVKLDTLAATLLAGHFTATDWEAVHLTTYQQGGVAYLVRGYAAGSEAKARTIGKASIVTADVAAGDFAVSGNVGDPSTGITDLVEAQGLLYVSKEDNLYEFDQDSQSRPIIPFLNRANVNSRNGKYTYAFGDLIFYPTQNGLWRYTIGGGAIPFGVDNLKEFTDGDGVGAPTGGTYEYRTLVSSGGFLYATYGNGGIAYLEMIDMTLEDYPRHFISQTTVNRFEGAYIDSNGKLWLLHSTSGGSNPWSSSIIALDNQGGIEFTARSTTDGGTMYQSEVDFDTPFDKKRWAAMEFHITGASPNVQPKYTVDGGAVTNLGGAITSAGLTSVRFSNVTGYRLRPVFKLENSNVGEIRKVRVTAKKPYIYDILIPADNFQLAPYGLEEEQVWTNLTALLNAGEVEFEHFDQTVTAGNAEGWLGEVVGLTTTTYTLDNGSIGRAIKLKVESFSSV